VRERRGVVRDEPHPLREPRRRGRERQAHGGRRSGVALVRDREQQSHERYAIADRVMNPRDEGRASGSVLDDMHLPEGRAQIEHLARELGREARQRRLVVRRWQRGPMQVTREGEARILLPRRSDAGQRRLDRSLTKSLVPEQPRAHERLDLGEREHSIEAQDRGDHHALHVAVHAQPRGVHARESFSVHPATVCLWAAWGHRSQRAIIPH
jgi:hypothetical protein